MRALSSPVMSSEQPMSRTMQYKKVMKPLLERKRRARINQCLEELKELMVTAIQAEGENVSKLEKADVLELTVAHLRKLHDSRQLVLPPQPVDPVTAVRRFQAGFARCVQEVDTFFETAPAHPAARGLVSHLHDCLNVMDATDKTQPIRVAAPTPAAHPMAPYQKALHHLRAQEEQQQQQKQQQGLLMPVRVLVRDDKPVTSPGSVSSMLMESEDESMHMAASSNSGAGLDLRVRKESCYSSAMSSCYDSSDEDVWRPW